MKKSILAIVISITLLFASVPSIHAAGTPSAWAVQEIEAATKDGLITDSISANYQAYITRAQFCELVLKAYEKLSNTSAEVGDVHFNDTDNPEILKAANLGIVTGHGDGSFAPDEKITREQIATMLSRMIGKAVPSEKTTFFAPVGFSDWELISDWAVIPLCFLYDKGIMQGTGKNCISPKANTTCEQAVLLVYRTVRKYTNTSVSYDYDRILAGDFSQFVGSYVNQNGVTFVLTEAGADFEPERDIAISSKAEDITKNPDGSYSWAIMSYYDGNPVDGVGVILYPIGVEVKRFDGYIVPTDTGTLRLWMGNGNVTGNALIWYKQ